MDFTTYEITPLHEGLIVQHTLCLTRIIGWESEVYVLTLSELMQAATQHNAHCPAIRRV